MTLELRPDNPDELRRILKTVARAVNRHQSLAALHVVDHRLLRLRGDLGPVGVNRQRVILREVGGIDVGKFVRVSQIDPLGMQRRQCLKEAGVGLVVSAVAEKKNFEPAGFISRCDERRKERNKCEDGFHSEFW